MDKRLKARLDALLAEKAQVLIAVDGSCTAGKTTLAGKIAAEYDCNVFHMDEFFLQPHQRTPERFAQAGGNVDYERFRAEVLLPLKSGLPFSYRPFSCKSLALTEPVEIQPKKLNIIEGTYSLHPYFGEIYDLKVLLTVSPALQRQRILERPAHLHSRFFREWIPMEQRYFEELHIADQCDLIL